MPEEMNDEEYVQVFVRFSTFVEGLLQKVLLILLVVLLALQLLMQFDFVREWVTTIDRLEGIPFMEIEPLKSRYR